jgi:hypothetical protein
MAELLSAVVLFQLAEPGCALISGVGSAVAEMRTGGYIAAGPEIGLINLTCLEMSKYYGMLTQATGISADAKAPNFQAGSEGGMTGLCAALAGADSLIATGAFDGVQTESLAKAVLDNDQLGALRRYVRETVIDDNAAHDLVMTLGDLKEIEARLFFEFYFGSEDCPWENGLLTEWPEGFGPAGALGSQAPGAGNLFLTNGPPLQAALRNLHKPRLVEDKTSLKAVFTPQHGALALSQVQGLRVTVYGFKQG